MSFYYGRYVNVIFKQFDIVGGKKVYAADQLEVGNDPETKAVGLRTTFHVSKTYLPHANPAVIEIHNLTQQHRAYIESKQCEVFLHAGYVQQFSQIFQGDVTKVTTKREHGAIVSVIEAADASLFLGRKETTKSFGPGIKAGSVLDQFINALGLAVGQIKGFDRDQQYLQGFSFAGLVRDGITLLTQKQGIENSVQDGKLYILPEKVAVDGDVPVFSPDSGLIGSPFKVRVLRQDQAKKQNGLVAMSGAQSAVYLTGTVFPGKAYTIQSEFVTGTFKARNVIHRGDNWGSEWYTEMEGV